MQNIHRGRGLFCLSIMKSQVASPSYTPIFAALVSVIATRLPEVATLLVHRLVAQFKRAFKRNDREMTSSVVTFLCHLANQQVDHCWSCSLIPEFEGFVGRHRTLMCYSRMILQYAWEDSLVYNSDFFVILVKWTYSSCHLALTQMLCASSHLRCMNLVPLHESM